MSIKQTLVFASITLFACNALKKDIKIESNYEIADIYANSITEEQLKEHLGVLASDEYEGRETAMPGQKKAAAYIENYFKSIDLKPAGDKSFQQSFPVVITDPKAVNLSIGNSNLTFLEDYYYLGYVGDTTYEAIDLLYLGYGIDQPGMSDYNGINVKGKFIIVKDGLPSNRPDIEYKWAAWREKLAAAKNHGALGLIVLQEEFDARVERIKQFVENPQMQLHDKGIKKQQDIPCIFLNAALEPRLIAIEKQESSFLKQKVTMYFSTQKELSSENVLAYVPGSDLKNEVIVISAHYDHIGYDNGKVCNGADDDGSGTVALLEIAEAFQKAYASGHGPRRTILFLSVSGEEKGLFGSEYYTNHPVFPLENTVVDLNIDMIGRIDDSHKDNKYVYLIGSDRISYDLHKISESVNKSKINFTLDYTYNDENDPNNFYYRSDHYNFAKNGIPVIFYFSGVHEDYHKPTDDVEKIDFVKLSNTTKLVFYTAWELANRTERIKSNSPKYKSN